MRQQRGCWQRTLRPLRTCAVWHGRPGCVPGEHTDDAEISTPLRAQVLWQRGGACGPITPEPAAVGLVGDLAVSQGGVSRPCWRSWAFSAVCWRRRSCDGRSPDRQQQSGRQGGADGPVAGNIF